MMQAKAGFLKWVGIALLVAATSGMTAEENRQPQVLTEVDIIKSVFPLYPEEWLKAGVPGWAAIKMTISLEGEVEKAEVLGATKAEFGEAARSAFSKEKYIVTQRIAGGSSKPEIIKIWIFHPRIDASQYTADWARRYREPPENSVDLQPKIKKLHRAVAPRRLAADAGALVVYMTVTVGADGELTSIMPSDWSLNMDLIIPAVEAVLDWEFDPAKNGSFPVKVRRPLHVLFEAPKS